MDGGGLEGGVYSGGFSFLISFSRHPYVGRRRSIGSEILNKASRHILPSLFCHLRRIIVLQKLTFITADQVYFGFSHCPDICPDELDKMARMIDLINGPSDSSTAPWPPSTSDTSSSPTSPTATSPTNSLPVRPRPTLLPLFITCDPARDTPAVLRPYLADFHPSFVGLTGTWQQVKDACRAYRVYFSTPEGAKPGTDYLVDHSIYFYLMGMFLILTIYPCELWMMGWGEGRK